MKRLIAGTINFVHAEEGWENVHIDISSREIWDPGKGPVLPDHVLDISDEEAMDGTFDYGEFNEIRCHHVLEHLHPEDGQQALRNFHRILVTGGVLDIEVPDFERVVLAWQDGNLNHSELQQWVYGEHLLWYEEGDLHKTAYTESILRGYLNLSFFEVGEREETGLALRFLARRI